MKIHIDPRKLPSFRKTVLTIGTFDGVHCGHQKVLRRLTKEAEMRNAESIVITFWPHPRTVVDENSSVKILSTNKEKVQLLEKAGIDHLVIMPFTKEFADLTPKEYLYDFIIKLFNPQLVVVGFDHRFGKGREGTFKMMSRAAEKEGFDLIKISREELNAIKVSSTRIRQSLEDGRISKANELAGHPYLICGKVVSGDQDGQAIGYPTANIEVPEEAKLIPPDGIYAATCNVDSEEYQAMLYIGRKPTFSPVHSRRIEIHLLDFSDNLYGKEVCIKLHSYIRKDEKMDSKESLKDAIKDDEKQIRNYFTRSAAVAILNWNGADFLERFLPSVIKHLPEGISIYVGDNNSTDRSAEVMKRFTGERIHFIQLDKNYGFAEGYNRLLEKIEVQYYILLNSDVEVEEDWISPILEVLDNDSDVAVAQPKIRSEGNKDFFEYAGAAGGYLDVLGYPFCRGRIFDTVEKDHGQYNVPVKCAWATGCAMVLRSDVFKETGGFDPALFAHQEEIDLCWRIRQLGYNVVCLPYVQVYHVGGGALAYSSPYKTYLNFRNNRILLTKNLPFLRWLWLYPLRTIIDLSVAASFLAEGEFDQMKAAVKGICSEVGRLRTTWKKRRNRNIFFQKTGHYRGTILTAIMRGKKRFSALDVKKEFYEKPV